MYILQGSYPEDLAPASNSIVCTESAELMTDLFNVTPSIVRPISFPSKECRTAMSRCENCLEQEYCLAAGIYGGFTPCMLL